MSRKLCASTKNKDGLIQLNVSWPGVSLLKRRQTSGAQRYLHILPGFRKKPESIYRTAAQTLLLHFGSFYTTSSYLLAFQHMFSRSSIASVRSRVEHATIFSNCCTYGRGTVSRCVRSSRCRVSGFPPRRLVRQVTRHYATVGAAVAAALEVYPTSDRAGYVC
jgi:transposase InsO family protein